MSKPISYRYKPASPTTVEFEEIPRADVGAFVQELLDGERKVGTVYADSSVFEEGVYKVTVHYSK